LSNALEITEPTASQAGSKETTMATAIQQLAGAQNGVIAKSVSAGNIVLASAEVYYNYRVNITGATVAGRTVTLPQKIRTFLMYSDSGNTQDISIIRGSTTIVLHPDTTYLVYTDGTANGLQAYVLAIGSAGGFFVPVGGASGYVLKKTSATDGAFAWSPDLTSKNPQLTADTTFYVRTDGSDSNNGLANTAGGAFLTVQYAIDYLQNTDLGGFTATIQIADGTYTAALIAHMDKPARNGYIKIVGNVATPANVILQASGTVAVIQVEYGATLELAGGFKVQRSAANNLSDLIIATNASQIIISGEIIFGTGGNLAQLTAIRSSVINVTASAMTFSGSGTTAINSRNYSAINFTTAITITISGTPAYSITFVLAQVGATVNIPSTVVTFSGSATGKRYLSAFNSLISVGAGSETFIPGSTPGERQSTSFYLSSAISGANSGNNGFALPTALTADTTLDLSHQGQQVGVNSATDKTITVPPNSSVAFLLGSVIMFEQQGAGQIIIAAGAGVTISSSSSLKSRTQNSIIRLIKTGTNTWTLSGDLEDVPVLYLFAAGVPTANEVLWVQKFAKVGFKLPASLTGSNATLQTAATASTTFTIKNNGSSIGTIVFGVGGTSATFTFSSAVVFAVNDVLTIVAPASPDATAAGLAISLKGG
jgi:hypothetical protein